MAVPDISNLSPTTGPSSGGDVVRLTGTDFAQSISAQFGNVQAEVIFVSEGLSPCIADVRTPSHEPSVVDVSLQNLDADGNPIVGEEAVLPNAYQFLREEIVQEATLTRLVRRILRELKKQVLTNTSISVSVDYDDTVIDGMNVIALAKLPSVVLSGPRLRENKFYTAYEPQETVVNGALGLETIRHRPPYTVDAEFTLTVASDSTAELLNLMAATATFLNRNRWLDLPRDSANPIADMVRWEMDPVGEFRTNMTGPNGVKAFTCGFVVRGFDIDEGLPLDASTLVDQTHIEAERLNNGGLN